MVFSRNQKDLVKVFPLLLIPNFKSANAWSCMVIMVHFVAVLAPIWILLVLTNCVPSITLCSVPNLVEYQIFPRSQRERESTKHQASKSCILRWWWWWRWRWRWCNVTAVWNGSTLDMYLKTEAMTFTCWLNCEPAVDVFVFKLSFHTTNESLMFVYISPSPAHYRSAVVVVSGPDNCCYLCDESFNDCEKPDCLGETLLYILWLKQFKQNRLNLSVSLCGGGKKTG